MLVCLAWAACFAVLPAAGSQEPGQSGQPLTVDRTLATLHGVVRNTATGQGLARALVRIEGDADTGVLTDGEGRFEIPNIPVGAQSVEVRKPGFVDRSFAGAASGVEQFIVATATGGHNVMVATEMPDVVFTLAPTCAIHGRVELSTGDAAQGITISLAQRRIENGRALWQAAGGAKTRSDGTFRFAGLVDGEYAVFSQPTMDTDLDAAAGPAGMGARWGYASVYYPDAREPSGAAKIHLANGQEAQANLTLTREAFQPVIVTALTPQMSAHERAGMNYAAVVMDEAGHSLSYTAQYDPETHSVQALLPDGSYTMTMSTLPRPRRMISTGEGGDADVGTQVGAVSFSVAGRAIPNLRVPLAAAHPSAVQLTVIHGGTQAAGGSGLQGGMVSVMVSQAGGWIDDSILSQYATVPATSAPPWVTQPGAYWVHTSIGQRGLCQASFTAGGANLAREPVVLGVNGSTAPMELTLRDDCASLQVSLPEALGSIAAGEEPFYTVYVVPDFDFTTDLTPATLRASTGGTVTVRDLTPGTYHVYTFAGAVELEYRNRAALGNAGQAITLSPGTTGSLVVEVGGR